MNAVMFSSVTDGWPTPSQLFARLDARFRFTLDPCASAANAKCASYYTPADDGLSQPWAPHSVFMNPPYGRTIGSWVAKAHTEAGRGALVVCLLPARTDTAWWHDHVRHADRVRFLRGRVRFGEAKQGAPFPSVVVVFEPQTVTATAPNRNACRGCSGPLLAARSDAQYCSSACRQRAYRDRRAKGVAPGGERA